MFQVQSFLAVNTVVNVIEGKSVCWTLNEAKQYQNITVWSREGFIAGPCKEMGGLCLKNPKLPQKLSAKPFYRKSEGGHG